MDIARLLKLIAKWMLLLLVLAAVVGSAVAFFLWSLDAVTLYRFGHPWLLYLLPLAGIAIHFLYKWAGKNAEKGNNLIIDEIHAPGAGVPARMAPLVLLSTLVTHLFGGSAGREGTAVQMGGSFADFFVRLFTLDHHDRRLLLLCGVAAGFGAVFGTPVTGAIFALEVLIAGKIDHRGFLPCLLSAWLAKLVVDLWGVAHTHYQIGYVDTANLLRAIHWREIAWVLVAGLAFGLVARLFVWSTDTVKNFSLRWIKWPWMIPAIGALILILLTVLLGTDDYLGLGVQPAQADSVTLVSAFRPGGADTWSWLLKLLFTAITLGTGFKGGEVTPLFFIGATLGHSLAVFAGMPIDLFAALGFIAVFSGATNTPVACTVMGVELFGGHFMVYYAIACVIAFYVSGRRGIYHSQLPQSPTFRY